MPRARSASHFVTEEGREVGVTLTDRDRWMLRELTRWYALSPAHLARRQLIDAKELWHPAFGADPKAGRPVYEKWTDNGQYWRRSKSIALRLGRLSRVVERPGFAVAPFVSGVKIAHRKTAWWATPAGARHAGLLSWGQRQSINVLYAWHAFAAADIGLQLESYEWTVLSERELSRGLFLDGGEVPTKLMSPLRGNNGDEVLKKPDLAILRPGTFNRYIAVEIERDQDRPIRTYVDKLRAYQNNTCIDAVWYVCISDTTAERVRAAARRVFKERPVRVRVVTADTRYGFWHIPNFNPDDNPDGAFDQDLNDDLRVLIERERQLGITAVGD